MKLKKRTGLSQHERARGAGQAARQGQFLRRCALSGLVMLCLTGCKARRSGPAGVELVLNPDALSPTTTFELRFNEAVVGPEELGRTAPESPLVIIPPVRGSFVWLSQRSGVFTPVEPTGLGRAYRFRLKPGLRTADGHLLRARLDLAMRTPDFAVTHCWPPGGVNTNAPVLPTFQLGFNAAVKPEAAQPYVSFRSSDAGTVEAKITQPTRAAFRALPFSLVYPLLLPLPEAGTGSGQSPPSLASEAQPAAVPDDSPVPHALTVTPASPLAPGHGWELIVAAGLPATGTKARLARAFVVLVGEVQPFIVTAITAHNSIRAGRRIEISFSKSLAPKTEMPNILDWISLTPAPTNLQASASGHGLWLEGDLSATNRYTLALRAGLPAGEPVTLAQPHTNEVEFQPVPARLYFAAGATEQWRGGRREFPLLAVNVASVNVRAKLLDRHTLIHALRGYRFYDQSYGDDWNYLEPFREVRFEFVPGRTVFTNTLILTNELDVPGQVQLHWNDLLPGRQAGAVFLQAECRTNRGPAPLRLGTEALVQLTDLGLVWKRNAEQVAARVFSYTSGRGVPRVRLSVLDEENTVQDETATDEQGFAQLALRPASAWLMAQDGDDLRAAELSRGRVPLYRFGLRREYSGNRQTNRLEALLFTDRPVYRPGDTAQFKAIVRDWREGRWAVPTGLTTRLRCLNSRSQQFYETNLTLTAHGSLAHAIPLPPVGLGEYTIELELGGEDRIHSFLVEEYQANAFELKLEAPPVVAADEQPRIAVSAQYFLGQPVSKGKVEWSLEARDLAFAPAGLEDYEFCSTIWQEDLDRRPSSFALTGEGTYAATNFIIAPLVPVNSSAPQPRACELTVELTDLNQQTITRQVSFLRHSSDFYLGLRRLTDVARPGDDLPLELVAVHSDGQPLLAPVKAQVVVQRVTWHTLRKQTAGGVAGYETEAELTPLTEFKTMTCPLTRAGHRWAPETAAGPPPTFRVPAAGQFLIEARAQDRHGRDVVTAVLIQAQGEEEVAWDYQNGAHLGLEPDKETYQPGEIATLLVKTPISGQAWVTVEREKVLRAWVTNLTGNAPALYVPLEPNDAPNVYVSVTLVRGASDCPKQPKVPEYRLGYCQLRVERPHQKLRLDLTTSSAEYQPGDRVRVAATATDAENRPVPAAEVTLFAVDEGVLSLTDFQTPDPYAWFTQARPIEVDTGMTLPQLLPEAPEQWAFQNKGYLVGDGGRGLVRQHFVPCALWQAALLTDATGQITATFDAPDSLTKYRVMAVAHTTTGQFGHGETSIQINKPLMIEPASPRLANVGDRLLARAAVFNRTAQAGDLEVRLELDDKAIHDGPASAASTSAVRRLSVAAQGALAVDFPVRFVAAGPARWVWHTRWADEPEAPDSAVAAPKTRFTDAAQSAFTVGYPSPMLREVHLTRTGAGATNLLAAFNPQLLAGNGTVTVRVSNSRIACLGEAVAELLQYPYGCVEQTASSLLPWIVLRHAPVGPLQGSRAAADADAVIHNGVHRLLSMQTARGGLSYWPGGTEPTLWGSAYGGMMLALARREGAPVPVKSLESLATFLAAGLRDSAMLQETTALADRCLALSALALLGKPEPAYHEVLAGKREQLDTVARAWLALAILESGGPKDLAAPLLQPGSTPNREALSLFGNAASELAIRLLAWTQLQPDAWAVDVLVTELVQAADRGHWASTQGNAWAVLALSAYRARVESGRGPAQGTLVWGSRRESFAFGAEAATFERAFPFGGEAVPAPLLVETASSPPLFIQTVVEARPPVVTQPRQERGLSLEREYQRLDDQNQPQPLEPLRVGDRVLITLRLEARAAAHYVVVDDALPALFEALNPHFVTQQTAGGHLATDWVSDHRELRADRAVFFVNHLAPGHYHISYLARVRVAGTAYAPAAKAEEMYHPERFGLAAGLVLTAQPLESLKP
jgi:uncharacterized protein YfaS (alpha-2-macroglobulin family)